MRKVILLTAMPKEGVWSSSIYVNGGGLLSSKISFSRILLLFVCCIFCNNVFAQNDWRLVQDFESLTNDDVKACINNGNKPGDVSSGDIATASIENVEGHGKVGQFQMLQNYQGHHGIVFSVNLGTKSLKDYNKIKFNIRYLSGDCMQKHVYVAVRNESSSDGFDQLAIASEVNGNEFVTEWQSFEFENISSSDKDYSRFEIFISLDTQSQSLTFQIDNIQLYGPAIGSSEVNISESADNSITKQDGVTVNLTRSLVKGMWNTICLPFAPTSTQADAIFGKDAKFAEFTSVSNGVMQFTSVVGSLEAGKPYLVLPTENCSTGDKVVLTGVNITATSAGEVPIDGYTFKGIYSPTPFAEGIWPTTRFVGTGNNLLKPNTEKPLKALRAYFTVPVPSGSGALGGAKNYTFAVDSFVPTSIANIQIEGDGDGAIYNIGGQRVEGKSLPKGIYIRDGKKFVVK